MPLPAPRQALLDELHDQMERFAKADRLIVMGHRAIAYGEHMKNEARRRARQLESQLTTAKRLAPGA